MDELFNDFPYSSFFTGWFIGILIWIGIKRVRIILKKDEKISNESPKAVQILKSSKRKKKGNRNSKIDTSKKSNSIKRLPRIIFIIVFLQVCMYTIGHFSSSNRHNYTDWVTHFPDFAFNNAALGLVLTIFYLIFLYTSYKFLIPLYEFDTTKRIVYLDELKKDKRFILSTESLLIIIVLRLIIISIPFFFESKFINDLSYFINMKFFPFIKIGAIKIWTSVISGIIIPGIVGNFFYDILKSFILRRYFQNKKVS